METPSPASFYPAGPPIPTTELPNEQQVLGGVRRGMQQESKLAKIPCEVFLMIIGHLDMAEKAALLATCQYLRQVVEPIQYSCLGPEDTWKSHRRIRLLQTLGERQDLLPLIRSFRGFLVPSKISGPHSPLEKLDRNNIWPNAKFQDEWLAIAAPLFKQAINIRDLDIMGALHWGENGSWKLFEELVSNMKLNSLALNSSSSEQQDFTPLLRSQPELTRLELDWPTAQFEGLRSEDVPQLTIFKGTLSQAAMVVPGRPVRKLGVTCAWQTECQCLNEHMYQNLALSSETIKEFKMMSHARSSHDPFRPVLHLIAQYLPRIETLTISLDSTISAEILLDEIPKYTSLRHLVLLEVEIVDPSSLAATLNPEFPRFGVKDGGRLSERLKGLCPSLTDFECTPRRPWVCGNAAYRELRKRRDYL